MVWASDGPGRRVARLSAFARVSPFLRQTSTRGGSIGFRVWALVLVCCCWYLDVHDYMRTAFGLHRRCRSPPFQDKECHAHEAKTEPLGPKRDFGFRDPAKATLT